MKVLIIPEEIKNYLDYNELTGELCWIGKPAKQTIIGSKAGALISTGYIQIGFKNSNYQAHRIAWFLKTGEQPPNEIDHIDEVKHNNKWVNLRKTNPSQNQCNVGKYTNNTSGFKGVTKQTNTDKWKAQIGINNKVMHLGLFSTPEEAHLAYCEAADKYHKEFSNYG